MQDRSSKRSSRWAPAALTGLLAANAHAATSEVLRELADEGLDAITAGTAQAGPVPATAATVVVADGATLSTASVHEIVLGAHAQADSHLASAVNASASDVGNAVNVLGGPLPAATALQVNELRQSELQGGFLGRSTLAGEIRRQRRELRVNEAFSDSLSQSTALHSRTRSLSSVVEQFAAEIPELNPLQDLTLTVGTPALRAVSAPRFEIDFIAGEEPTRFGIGGGIGPLSLGVPRLVLGTVSLDGDDVVLSSGFVDMPAVDLGSADLEVCLGLCGTAGVDLGSFDGKRIALPGDSLRLEGANPFGDVHINAGAGVALAGSGTISMRPGSVTLGASLSLDLPDLTTSIDFKIPGFAGIGPYDVSTPSFGIEIPAVQVSHTLIDAEFGATFDASFDGVLCLALHTTDCGSLSHTQTTLESRIEEWSASTSASAAAGSSASGSASLEVTGGATLRDAEAELIAMSAAQATITAANAVELADGAQAGMTAINAVNASAAIIGNAVNVAARTGVAQTAASGALAMTQSNQFTQLRTRYGRD